MKCPKCGYIGFEPADRCRNCGYDFALVEAGSAESDLPLRGHEPAPAPLGDFDLGDAARPPREASARRRYEGEAHRLTPPDLRATPPDRRAAVDLPLFGDADDLPIVPAAAPTPPLAVRRSNPPAAKSRSRATPRAIEPPAGASLPLSSAALDPTPAAGTVARPDAPTEVVPSTRVLAGLIDAVLLAGADAVVIYFTLKICRLAPADVLVLPPAPLAAFLLLFNGGYLALLTAAGGQTLGKMALGLKVERLDQGRLTVSRALVRTCALLVGVLAAGLGWLPALFGDHRGVHDRLAGTRVVRVTAS